MAPDDIAVWERYLTTYPMQEARVDYDVRVGEGVNLPDETPPELRRMAKLLTQKRIDAVVYRTEAVWVIEIKPEAGIAALGQVLTYTALFIAHYKPDLPAIPVIICDHIDRDMSIIFKSNGITTITV